MKAERLKELYGPRLLCHVVPSLTIYLAESPDRAQGSTALSAYQSVCPAQRQKLVTGSNAPAFTKLADTLGQNILEKHLDRMDRRKDQAIVVWDGELEESWSFTLQGVPPQGGKARASFCHVVFPNDVEQDSIVQLAVLLAERLPILSGHGGLTALFDAEYKQSAFDKIYAWAKPYPGLEVEDLNVTVNHVAGGLKGANWLTLVGIELWERLTQIRAGEPSFSPEIEVLPERYGVVIRAGSAPVLGDRNRGEWPALYREVEQALAPIKLQQHGEFPGRFEDENVTSAWLRRFLEPGVW